MARVVVGRQPPLLVAPAARRGWRIRARDCLSAAGASSSETPPAPSTAGCGLLGSDTHFTAVRSTAPSGRAEGSVNWGSDPKNPSQTVGLPRSEAQGSQTEGRLFFGDFLLAKQKKVTAPPGAHPGSRPPQKHTINYKNNSCQRLPHKRKTPKTLNISTARNTSSAPPRAPGAAYGCPAPAAAESAAARSRPSPAHRPGPCGAPARSR